MEKTLKYSKPKPIPIICNELGAIVRQISKLDQGLDISIHLEAIHAKRAQETECFLRACTYRLDKAWGLYPYCQKPKKNRVCRGP